ncbi:MAG: dihydrolipoyl dehydrogenase [Magnetococcales bacterium]|nr:dihydrolipoyl dehydrogenase [Magnetococcales bacterium]
MDNIFDLIVIGGGPGGYVAAIRAAQLGLKTACIEQEQRLGGTCLNRGCIPSKALLESSSLWQTSVKDLAEHGVDVQNPSLNLAAMMARKDKIVAGLSRGIVQLFKKNKVQHIVGRASLESANTITVVHPDETLSTLTANRVLLATGSVPIELPFMPFDGKRIVDSTDALAFSTAPKQMIVVGGGVIGLELGSVWQRLGCKVTVVEALTDILPGIDVTLVRHAKRLYKKQGLKLMTKQRVTKAVVSETAVTLTCRDSKDQQQDLTAECVLVSVGRRANSNALGLSALGIDLDRQGRINVDASYQTSCPGVYAVGDLVAGPMLAHKAEEEGVVAVERMVGRTSVVHYEHIPAVVYTQPEIATVGLTEAQAKQSGKDILIGSFPFMANGRARCSTHADGVVKLIFDAQSEKLLGGHLLGPHVSELIASVTTALCAGWTRHQLVETVLPHPTLSEAIREAAMAAVGEAIHI